MTNSTTREAVRQPLTPRLFFVMLAVLAIGLMGFDVALNGPITWSVAHRYLIAPAEQEWGFHAEWKDYGPPNDSYSVLTVVRVTAGGAFDRAGIKPGFAFAPRHSATGGPTFGGPYSVFSGERSNVRIRMLEDPNERWREHTYAIRR